ncbi:MAG: hypothetical protein Q8R25_00305 [bacterium]|nr:hypothetical protein [bacterium]
MSKRNVIGFLLGSVTGVASSYAGFMFSFVFQALRMNYLNGFLFPSEFLTFGTILLPAAIALYAYHKKQNVFALGVGLGFLIWPLLALLILAIGCYFGCDL